MVKKITKYDILSQYLEDYNQGYYLRELASLLKRPHQTIKPYVEGLTKEGILIKNKRKNIIEYNLNIQNKKVYHYLTISEKEKLMERLNKDTLLNILFEKLSSSFNKNAFIVFGSSVEKIQKGSDIDLLIVGKSNLNKIIKKFEEIYNKKIHKVQISTFNQLSSALIKEIYKKHLILNNAETIVRFFGGLYEKNKLV